LQRRATWFQTVFWRLGKNKNDALRSAAAYSPKGSQAEIAVAFADTCRVLTNRTGIFVNLPLASLAKMALQKKLQQIGALQHPAGPASS